MCATRLIILVVCGRVEARVTYVRASQNAFSTLFTSLRRENRTRSNPRTRHWTDCPDNKRIKRGRSAHFRRETNTYEGFHRADRRLLECAYGRLRRTLYTPPRISDRAPVWSLQIISVDDAGFFLVHCVRRLHRHTRPPLDTNPLLTFANRWGKFSDCTLSTVTVFRAQTRERVTRDAKI